MMADDTSLQALTTNLNRRLVTVTIFVVIMASIFITIFTLVEFNAYLKPELEKKAYVSANSIRSDVEHALEAGIPLDKIRGMDTYLGDIASDYKEFLYVFITDPQGKPIYRGGDYVQATFTRLAENAQALPQNTFEENKYGFQHLSDGVLQLVSLIPFVSGQRSDILAAPVSFSQGGEAVGKIHIGLDAYFIRGELTNVFFDILIILIAVILVSIEFILVMVLLNISLPVQRLEEVLRLQSTNDFSRIANSGSKDEIGRLVGILNNAALELQTKYKELYNKLFARDKNAADKLRAFGERFHLQSVFKSKADNANMFDARIPLFVFSFAEELQKSFMPLYVDALYSPVFGLSRDIIIGMPIALFMLVIAIATPFAGGWADKYGNKRLFLIGLVPAVTGYIGCALATNIYDVLIWRGATAAGYAIIVISCQGYIAATLTRENRAKGMAVFVGILMSATMCGTALGGIVADRIGYHPVFFLSAIFASIAGLCAWKMMSAHVRDENVANAVQKETAKDSNKVKRKGGVRSLFRNRKLMALILFCAIPVKIVLTGFFYYLIPLYLVSLGSSTAETGRIMMLYALLIIPISPIAARYVDKTQRISEMVVVGSFMSGIVLVVLSNYPSVWALVLAVALLGVAHGVVKAPLIAAVLASCEGEKSVGRTQILGILRTSERIGSVAGPIIVGGLVTIFGYGVSMGIIGAMVLVISFVMALTLKFDKSSAIQEGD